MLYAADGAWQTKWVCANDSDAYVDGGMYFKQDDKKLYVPACGYYHISSQIYFQEDQRDSNGSVATYVSHEVQINRMCNYDDDFVLLRSYSTLVITPTKVGKATTYILSLIHI